jgi:hypothetical protein
LLRLQDQLFLLRRRVFVSDAIVEASEQPSAAKEYQCPN